MQELRSLRKIILLYLANKDVYKRQVLEMGISDFGEMDRLSKIAQPDICVITNIGFCHLENLEMCIRDRLYI